MLQCLCKATSHVTNIQERAERRFLECPYPVQKHVLTDGSQSGVNLENLVPGFFFYKFEELEVKQMDGSGKVWCCGLVSPGGDGGHLLGLEQERPPSSGAGGLLQPGAAEGSEEDHLHCSVTSSSSSSAQLWPRSDHHRTSPHPTLPVQRDRLLMERVAAKAKQEHRDPTPTACTLTHSSDWISSAVSL